MISISIIHRVWKRRLRKGQDSQILKQSQLMWYISDNTVTIRLSELAMKQNESYFFGFFLYFRQLGRKGRQPAIRQDWTLDNIWMPKGTSFEQTPLSRSGKIAQRSSLFTNEKKEKQILFAFFLYLRCIFLISQISIWLTALIMLFVSHFAKFIASVSMKECWY